MVKIQLQNFLCEVDFRSLCLLLHLMNKNPSAARLPILFFFPLNSKIFFHSRESFNDARNLFAILLQNVTHRLNLIWSYLFVGVFDRFDHLINMFYLSHLVTFFCLDLFISYKIKIIVIRRSHQIE